MSTEGDVELGIAIGFEALLELLLVFRTLNGIAVVTDIDFHHCGA